ncbi:D-2-hydroxyacid dehydrogenase [Colwellia psychrerythraea]|uniref:Glycerate dehydrogenase n=1 Tax=Colwellia psychrerythraea TaxID=28229 RepID=A0A099KKA7_COLPS|nr:D-2-hydroxyacid dehydrogenase [Colwellia psychrerythraea]KGJ90675.1 Glycerate dehydrogenase [Colwellia psychrerythraea]
MRAVFLDKQTFSSNIDLSAIEQQVTKLTCYANTSPSEIIDRCLEAEVIITNKVLLTADILSALPKLKLICISATGYNNVDITAANRLNIAVTNVSGYAGQSVAQYVFAQLLEYYQQISHHNNNTEQGLWSTSSAFCYHSNSINELASKTIGIVGYGSLGKAVATIAHAFNMKVLIAERPKAKSIRAERTAFNQVIEQADIISLHCPQTPESENLINVEILSQMKNSAVLINTARGALVDETALLSALKNKKIAYAVLDVLMQEPPPADHLLLNAKLANLKITAHIAWASIEAQQRLINLLSDNIHAFKQGESVNRLD